jgi:hypothetical protein
MTVVSDQGFEPKQHCRIFKKTQGQGGGRGIPLAARFLKNRQ